MRPPHIGDLEAMIIAAIAADDWATVAYLQPQLDSLDKPHTHSLPASALWYASVGLHVFPLQPHHKTPHRGTRGFTEATTDAEQIRRWWTQWPNSNIGIATGHTVDVIDIDGPIGAKSWAENWEMLSELNHLGHVNTPRPGGTHIYIPTNPARRNKTNLLPGIDVRATGGYVVAPPSWTCAETGSDGTPKQHEGSYTWRTPPALSPAP